jgi:hypothetical protein
MAPLAKVLVIFLLGLLMSVAVCFGQSPAGGVNGTVTDSTGSVVPAVTVSLTNQGTGIVATAATNASGVYDFVNVAPGLYTLKAEKFNFKTTSVAAFRINVNGTVKFDITLSVGQVAETAQVTGEASLLQASTSELGTVMGRQAIENLPMNGRNFTQLTLLVLGVSPVSTTQMEQQQCLFDGRNYQHRRRDRRVQYSAKPRRGSGIRGRNAQ